MAEMIPSVLLYGQALKLLEELQEAQQSGLISDVNDIAERLTDTLVRFEQGAGKPLTDYEPVVPGEPPQSSKSNTFWKNAERDVNLLQQQVDMLRASTILTHNTVKIEILEAQQENARVGNKLKTLQLYSNNSDANVITFGDSFQSFDQLDVRAVPAGEQPNLAHPGYVTLGRRGSLQSVLEGASVRILPTSNGFAGNNQEIVDPSTAITDPETGFTDYTFKQEILNNSTLGALVDEEPDTWFEYEQYQLSKAAKLAAANHNFTYSKDEGQGEDATTTYVPWADGPPGGVLRLGLEFDLRSVKQLNYIDIMPHGLDNDANAPFLVKRLQTSSNGTDWQEVLPSEVFIGTDVNLTTARRADNVAIYRAVWAFQARPVRYVRVYFEQQSSINVNVGHVYWTERNTATSRVEGPIPPEDDTDRFLEAEVYGDLVQHREYFPGKRWAIGLRDILLNQIEYVEKSVLVSRAFRPGGVIDRVVLERAEFEVPPEYPTNQPWVRFFVTPDDGESWIPISRIEDAENGIPEQISFNDTLPNNFRESGVLNVNLDQAVTSLRLKVEMSRPDTSAATTPVLKSYSLKVRRRV